MVWNVVIWMALAIVSVVVGIPTLAGVAEMFSELKGGANT